MFDSFALNLFSCVAGNTCGGQRSGDDGFVVAPCLVYVLHLDRIIVQTARSTAILYVDMQVVLP